MLSEALLVTTEEKKEHPELCALCRRVEGILVAREYCLLEYVVAKARLAEATAITPGVKSPTLSPVHDPEWIAVAAMVKRKSLNKVIDQLAAIDAHGIIAHQIPSRHRGIEGSRHRGIKASRHRGIEGSMHRGEHTGPV
jgi:ATP phosphoribosyltransferase